MANAQAVPNLNAEIITCCSCSNNFHALCTSVKEKGKGICNMSFLKLFLTPSTKSNFKWFCDGCLTKFENTKTTTIEERFTVLAAQIVDLFKEVNNVKDIVSSSKKTYCSSEHCDSTVKTSFTPWSDGNRVQNMKSSLVIKHKSGDTAGDAADLSKIREIVVQNNIPVSNVGVSKNGNTFINCLSVESRDELQPLLSDHLVNKEFFL